MYFRVNIIKNVILFFSFLKFDVEYQKIHDVSDDVEN